MPKLRESHRKLPQSEPKLKSSFVEDTLVSGQSEKVKDDREEKLESVTISVSGHRGEISDDREKQSEIVAVHDLSVSTGETGEKKRITVGNYEFSLPEEKLPLLAVMGCAVILFIAIFRDDRIYATNYKYGIFLSIFALIGGLVSIVIPTKKAIPLNYLIYILTYIGACLATVKFGPFNEPGNGYFASWGIVISSAIAADPPGSIKRAHFNTTLNVAAASLVFIISLLFQIIDGTEFQVEAYVAIAVAGVSFLIAATTLLLRCCYTTNTGTISLVTSIAFTTVAILWLLIACVMTFRGPFTKTGNGYFSAWFAVVMTVKTAMLEWRIRFLDQTAEG